MLLCFFVDDKNRWLLASDRMIGLSKLEIPTILSLRSLALLMLRIRTEDLICWNNVALVTAWRRDSWPFDTQKDSARENGAPWLQQKGKNKYGSDVCNHIILNHTRQDAHVHISQNLTKLRNWHNCTLLWRKLFPCLTLRIEYTYISSGSILTLSRLVYTRPGNFKHQILSSGQILRCFTESKCIIFIRIIEFCIKRLFFIHHWLLLKSEVQATSFFRKMFIASLYRATEFDRTASTIMVTARILSRLVAIPYESLQKFKSRYYILYKMAWPVGNIHQE